MWRTIEIATNQRSVWMEWNTIVETFGIPLFAKHPNEFGWDLSYTIVHRVQQVLLDRTIQKNISSISSPRVLSRSGFLFSMSYFCCCPRYSFGGIRGMTKTLMVWRHQHPKALTKHQVCGTHDSIRRMRCAGNFVLAGYTYGMIHHD